MSFGCFESLHNLNPSGADSTCIAITNRTRCCRTAVSPTGKLNSSCSAKIHLDCSKRGRRLYCLLYVYAKNNLCATHHRIEHSMRHSILRWIREIDKGVISGDLSLPSDLFIDCERLFPSETITKACASLVQYCSVPSPYVPFRCNLRRDTENLLLARLSERDKKSGYLYLFSKADSPGFVKIGTTRELKPRILQIRNKCRYTPKLLHYVADVPNARRVEQLIFKELHKYRRRETNCTCGVEHGEWFKVKSGLAKDTIRNWSSWFQITKPYDESGHLSQHNKNLVYNLRCWHECLTASVLLQYINSPKVAWSPDY